MRATHTFGTDTEIALVIPLKRAEMRVRGIPLAIKSGLVCMALGLVPPVTAKPLVIEFTQVGSEANTKLNAIDQKTRTLKWHDENSHSSFGSSLLTSFDLFDEFRLGFKYSPSSGKQVGQVGRYECFLLCAWVGSDVINGRSPGSILNYKINNFLFFADKEFR